MELKIQKFNVKGISFGKRTNYDHGILSINKKELVGLIAADPRLRVIDKEDKDHAGNRKGYL